MTDEIDLSQSDSELYIKLKSLHQSEFPNSYKLIAYYNKDTIDNPKYPGKILKRFVGHLAELDFPTFFVKIVTSYDNIKRDLKHLNSIYKNGIIENELSDISFIKEQSSTSTFCVLPWVHFYFNAQGQINPCCQSDTNYPLGDFTKDIIDFNSDKIIEFRQTLIDGLKAPQCESCYKKEESNIISPRQYFNQIFKKHIPINPTSIVKDFALRHLDIRINNLCNLKCRMCSGNYSSRIASEDFQIWGSTEFLNNSNSVRSEEKILQLVIDHIDTLERIYFAGGEPLINDFHYKILDILQDYKKTDIEIIYNTNFSIIDKAVNYWQKFSKITIGASIDLCGPASNYVRNGVEYGILKNNYVKLLRLLPNIDFRITSVLSLYNIFNLCDLQSEWISTMNLNPNKISFTILHSPENTSFTVLPNEFKNLAAEKINKHIFYLKGHDANNLIADWESALKIMFQSDNSHLLESFFKINDQRDQYRQQIFENYFPEFEKLRSFVNSV